MNIKKIISNTLINKSELARLVYPADKFPAQRLKQKIEGKYGQRITESDSAKIEAIIKSEFEL